MNRGGKSVGDELGEMMSEEKMERVDFVSPSGYCHVYK